MGSAETWRSISFRIGDILWAFCLSSFTQLNLSILQGISNSAVDFESTVFYVFWFDFDLAVVVLQNVHGVGGKFSKSLQGSASIIGDKVDIAIDVVFADGGKECFCYVWVIVFVETEQFAFVTENREWRILMGVIPLLPC